MVNSVTCFASIFKLVESPWGRGEEGYSDILIHTYGLDYFWFQNFEIKHFWVFQKNEYFWGYEEIVDNFWGHYIIGPI